LTSSTSGPDAAEILAALPAAVFVIDPQLCVHDVNAAAEMMLGVSAAHLKGYALSTAFALPSAWKDSGDGEFTAFDFTIQPRRGQRFRADFHASPFPDRPGWTLVMLNAGAGVQHMGNRFDQRAGARAAVGVAAMLAHEIKNPLSGIRGAAQLLESRVGEGDAAMTRLIKTEVDRVTALIDRMESFTDTRPMPLEPVNIHEIIDHARAVAVSGFGSKMQITELYDPSLPLVMVHRDSMVQVVLNLLKNAAETATHGEIRSVRLTTAYRHGVAVAIDPTQPKRPLPIELCVIDDGPGAPTEIADNLFDPFVSSKKTGRGLGLALVDKLVRDMGGIIQYAREGEPEKTVFRLLLPRFQEKKT
jgi:two-component system, NtrC family, nitrogen regulation sensor histidine kinase GlnL